VPVVVCVPDLAQRVTLPDPQFTLASPVMVSPLGTTVALMPGAYFPAGRANRPVFAIR